MKHCRFCGTALEDNATFCPKCGENVKRDLGKEKDKEVKDTPSVSPYNRTVAGILCFLLGGLGVHRFYVGKNVTGILMILTFGGLGVWTFIDLIMIVCGSFKDKQGRLIKNWTDEEASKS